MKTWGEMSDAEQGALLLAYHRGDVIEIWDGLDRTWHVCHSPTWVNGCAYRVKKEPVVEVRVQDAYFPGYGECADIQCTYTDGKLTKIHWDADQ